MPYCDVLIVGAGPAGSTTAFALARAGFEVVVLEREARGRDKPCGEGVQTPGLQVLQRMGLFEEACRNGVLFEELAFENRGRRLAIPLGGLAIRRRRLDALLAEAAEKAGALLLWRQHPLQLARENERWCLQTTGDRWCSRWLVGADGAHSWVRRQFGTQTLVEGDRAGLVAHTQLSGDASPEVRVFQCADAEIYTVPVDGATRLVAWLGGLPALQGNRCRLERDVSDVLQAAGIQAEFNDGRAVAPLMYRSTQIAGREWMLVGDAAAQTDPITGLGISNAMVGAVAAAKAIGTALTSPSLHDPEIFVRDHRRRHRSAARLARWIHGVLARPSLWPYLDNLIRSVPDLPVTFLRTFCPDEVEYDYAMQHVRPLLVRNP